MATTATLNILVLGAGELGLAVLSALASHPLRNHSRITVLIRSPKPALAAQLTTWHVSSLFADITTATSADLAMTFQGFDVVIGCTGMYAPLGTQLKLARAVIDGKVKRYIPWQFGMDYDAIGKGSGQDLFDEQLDVRQVLREQNRVGWVIVSTGLFMPFLFEEAFGIVTGLKGDGVEGKKAKVRALGGKENQITVTRVEDIGRVVGEVVFSAPETQGVIFISGETTSYGLLAGTLAEALPDVEVQIEDWTTDELRRELAEKPDDGMRKYRLVFANEIGVSWNARNTWNTQHRLRLQNLKEWCEQNLTNNTR